MWIERRIGRMLAGACLLVGLAGTPAAAAGDVFAVKGVAVDATAETAAAARDQALAYGQGQAIQRLWQRLVPAEAMAAIPPLSAAEVTDFVRDFSVSDERTSDVRYIATLDVRFRPDAVRRFLRASGVPFAEAVSKPLVVLPMMAEGESVRLWDEPNPWRGLWLNRKGEGGLVPLVTPLGDLSDMAAIEADEAAAGDAAALAEIAGRYEARGVLVTTARVQGDADLGQAKLRVVSQTYSDGAEPVVRIESFTQEQGEDLVGVLERAARTIDTAIQEEWKRTNLLRFEERNRLVVQVPLQGLEDLATVRRRLDGAAGVMEAELSRLSRSEAEIAIVYFGSPEQLGRTLAQSDLVLERVTGPGTPREETWILRPAGAARSPAPSPPSPDGTAAGQALSAE